MVITTTVPVLSGMPRNVNAHCVATTVHDSTSQSLALIVSLIVRLL
jgi:hypothetical protein